MTCQWHVRAATRPGRSRANPPYSAKKDKLLQKLVFLLFFSGEIETLCREKICAKLKKTMQNPEIQ